MDFRVILGEGALSILVLRISNFDIIVFQDVEVFFLLLLDWFQLFQNFGVGFLVTREDHLFKVIEVLGESTIRVSAGMGRQRLIIALLSLLFDVLDARI